jgi:hypothetical protein
MSSSRDEKVRFTKTISIEKSEMKCSMIHGKSIGTSLKIEKFAKNRHVPHVTVVVALLTVVHLSLTVVSVTI